LPAGAALQRSISSYQQALGLLATGLIYLPSKCQVWVVNSFTIFVYSTLSSLYA